ncbi:MAG: XRE family transcriptional regulator [Proteobacteria bacterium]|nr:XRE family transcriptional regulator [Pseudomonadota bacterium]
MMSKIDTSISHVTPAGGNIFTDLGFDQQESTKLKIKAQLMCQISEWVKNNHLKQEEAAKLLHVTRPRVSDIMRGKTGKFTIDTLVDLLERTGRHVTVQIT